MRAEPHPMNGAAYRDRAGGLSCVDVMAVAGPIRGIASSLDAGGGGYHITAHFHRKYQRSLTGEVAERFSDAELSEWGYTNHFSISALGCEVNGSDDVERSVYRKSKIDNCQNEFVQWVRSY